MVAGERLVCKTLLANKWASLGNPDNTTSIIARFIVRIERLAGTQCISCIAFTFSSESRTRALVSHVVGPAMLHSTMLGVVPYHCTLYDRFVER
jgi:hypothetical protein